MAPIRSHRHAELQQSYHSSLGCEPSRVFHGRIPYNVLDLNFGIRNQRPTTTTTIMGEDILHKTQQIKEAVNKNLMQSYVRYKQYYDKKVNTHYLNVNEYCYALLPKANTQGTKLPFKENLWTGPYIIVKVLPNNNYLIRKLQTNYTQILHRIRLKTCPTDKSFPDKPVLPKDYTPDKEVDVFHDYLYTQAWQSNFDDYTSTTPLPNRTYNNNSRVARRSTTQTNTPMTGPGDFPLEPSPEEHPGDAPLNANPDTNENDCATQNSPRKNKYNLRANPHHTGKRLCVL